MQTHIHSYTPGCLICNAQSIMAALINRSELKNGTFSQKPKHCFHISFKFLHDEIICFCFSSSINTYKEIALSVT